MKTPAHLLVGALAGAAPDALLALFAWRRKWLPETHPLVRAHRFLHSPAGVVVPLAAGWISHLVADRMSTHRGPDGTVTPAPWDEWLRLIGAVPAGTGPAAPPTRDGAIAYVRDTLAMRAAGRDGYPPVPRTVWRAARGWCAVLGHARLHGSAAEVPTCRRCLDRYVPAHPRASVVRMPGVATSPMTDAGWFSGAVVVDGDRVTEYYRNVATGAAMHRTTRRRRA